MTMTTSTHTRHLRLVVDNPPHAAPAPVQPLYVPDALPMLDLEFDDEMGNYGLDPRDAELRYFAYVPMGGHRDGCGEG